MDATGLESEREFSPGPVELNVPATGANAVIARIVAATLAAHLDYGLDRIDDLRVIADEFFSLVIDLVEPGNPVQLHLAITGGGSSPSIHLHSHGTTMRTRPPEPSDLRWTLLTALANDVALQMQDRTFVLDVEVAVHPRIPRPDN